MSRQTLTRTYGSLKAWREDQDWTVSEAARFLGLTVSLYVKYENREHSPGVERATAISAKTGVPFAILRGAQ